MIYLLYGSDTLKARIKLHELVSSLIKKKPDASHLRMNDETFDSAQIDEYIVSAGLFSLKTIIELDSIFKNKEAKEIVLEKIKEIAESENIFVFLEGELTKTDLKKFEKYAQKIQLFDAIDTSQSGSLSAKNKFSIFSLTDALGKRDKKQLFVLYQKAKMNGNAAEEIHGILFWQIKAMLQAQASKNAEEAGLNPYVYQKSFGFLRNFSKDELAAISSRLVSMYHEARRGMADFDVALEKFIIEV